MPCGLSRFDAPLNCESLIRWPLRTGIKTIGLNTVPFTIRKILREGVYVEAEEVPRLCTSTQTNVPSPDPIETAKCIISKPILSKMGEEEEKVYCGMIYGPEYTIYEHQANRQVAEAVEKLLLEHAPKILEYMEERKKQIRKEVQEDFKRATDLHKEFIIKELAEQLRCKEEEMKRRIILKRRNALMAKKGNMEREIREVNQLKKEHLNDLFEFKMKWILKNKEPEYLERMNMYSSVWHKIFKKLQDKASKKIDDYTNFYNQVIDEASLKIKVDRLKEDNEKRITEFNEEIKKTVKNLKAILLAEDMHINEEKQMKDIILNIVTVWKSLFEHVINLMDKVAFAAFNGRIGQCNYFVTINIIEDLKQISDAVEGSMEKHGTELQKESIEHSREKNTSKEEMINLSREKSCMTMDMGVTPPQEADILKLKLFQVKKAIEETTCLVIKEPLQISQYMKDRAVWLKALEKDEVEAVGSSYILNRLADAHCIIEKLLTELKRDSSTFVEVTEAVPYAIESDPDLTERVNRAVKAAFKVKNPDYVEACYVKI